MQVDNAHFTSGLTFVDFSEFLFQKSGIGNRSAQNLTDFSSVKLHKNSQLFE